MAETSLGGFIGGFDLKEGMAEEIRCATTVCRVAFELGDNYEEELETIELRFGAAFGRRHVVQSMGGGARAQRFVVWTARDLHSIEQLEDALQR